MINKYCVKGIEQCVVVCVFAGKWLCETGLRDFLFIWLLK